MWIKNNLYKFTLYMVFVDNLASGARLARWKV